MASDKLTLSELQLAIRDSLYISLPDFYWVTAEIAELKENYSGHCYLELIEKHADEKNVKARVKAIIWANRFRFLKPFFQDATGESLRDGLRVLVKVKIEYHEVYGLSLVISDIDPVFTIGEMAMKRKAIIKRLEDEGVFSMNKELELPLLPQRIAVISSRNAAGFSDFINHLKENRSGYVFHLALFEAAMQGVETEAAIIAALENIAAKAELFDMVVIIRGGGSLTDLSWFDNYNIAYFVTQFPLPVITGIGHDKDLSVTDMVANISLKTPTAVADFLIEMMTELEESLNSMSSEITELSLKIIETYKKRIDTVSLKLSPITGILMAGLRAKLADRLLEVVNIGKEYIIRAGIKPENQKSRLRSAVQTLYLKQNSILENRKEGINRSALNTINSANMKLSGLSNSLGILNPENVLKRGYTITSNNGKIIKSRSDLKNEDILETRFSDGTVNSRVIRK
jgi:exodeoxyribonuclease VII large subunit